ncbi:hypothetical protein H0H93_006835 [Arthromyces matolae]|nr:hypothetical protein H0H93_006835 [Arthromyces matolae]
MSTATQILFNSPALHSLKRDQLVKLCKVHGLKAAGKSSELVEKLKKHAETLPKDSPLSVAARSESVFHPIDSEGDETMGEVPNDEQSPSANARWGFQMPKPSQHWDVVMDNIEEVDEKSSLGSLSSLRSMGSNNGGSGEFGTGVSKSPSVASSLKSIASSLFKPSPSKSALNMSSFPAQNDTLAHTSMPYSSILSTGPEPQTDHFTFAPTDGNPSPLYDESVPLPGHSLRPGVPAPSDARLSLGLNPPSTPTREQPTTTIRLISKPTLNDDSRGGTPQLQPFTTNFDLEFGSPQPNEGFHGAALWPPHEKEIKSIYPPLPLEDLLFPSNNAPGPSKPVGLAVDTPTSLPTNKPTLPSLLSAAPKSSTTTQLAVPEAFVFGSPLPQHNVSNNQFKSAAASVLEEMNKRLKQDGVEGVGMDLISKLQPGAHQSGAGVLAPREEKEAPKAKIIKEKFDKMHDEEFDKMEGIDSLMRRRGRLAPKEGASVTKNRKSSTGHGVGRDRFGRRIGGESGRLSAAHVVSERRQSRVIPGSFDDDDDEEDKAEDAEGSGAKQADLAAMEEDPQKDEEKKLKEDEEKAEAEEEERKQKEKEAIKRKLEMNKAKRRSSAAAGAKGRVSVGRGGIVVKPQAAPTPAKPKFGFFASAKSLVQKVWGGGKSTTTESGGGSSTSSRLSSRSSSSSRLLAPTASSLAKSNRPSVTGSKFNLKSIAEGAASSGSQKPRSNNGESFAFSPRANKIFSKPLNVPSGIPVPVKKRTPSEQSGGAEKGDHQEMEAGAPKGRSLNGRKPRISRSKVIAKLASQREATASRSRVAPPGGTPSAKTGRTRSSLGVTAQRSSYAGKSGGAKDLNDKVLMSAKKRVRQSEYARRKSHVAPIDFSGNAKANAMEVDAEPHFTHLIGCIRAAVTPEGGFDEQVIMPYDQLLTHNNGVIITGEVKAIEEHGQDGGNVTLTDGTVIQWDVLVLAPGSRWEGPIALPTTAVESKRWFAQWQMKFRRSNDILLVGGGAVACEFAGEIKDLDPTKQVTIVHSQERIMNKTYPNRFRNDVQQRLLALGVTLILGDVVPESALHNTSGKKVVTRNGIVLTPDLIKVLTPAGHARIHRTFQLVDHPRIFACGDIADLKEQRQIGKYGAHAVVVAKNVLSLLNGGDAREKYKGHPEIMVLTLGKDGGAAYAGYAWGLTFGDKFVAHFKARELLVPMIREKYLGLSKR